MPTAKKKTAGSARARKTEAAMAEAAAKRSDDAALLQTPGQKVLVAEDNKVTQDLLKLLLKQRGHDVHIAANGQDALKALETEEFDVVLMDFHLPKMDGLKVATAFRAGDTASRPTRFIAITADMEGLLGHVDNCENFDSVLPKPFDLERVVQVVEGKAEEIYVPAQQETAPLQLRSGRCAAARSLKVPAAISRIWGTSFCAGRTISMATGFRRAFSRPCWTMPGASTPFWFASRAQAARRNGDLGDQGTACLACHRSHRISWRTCRHRRLQTERQRNRSRR